MSSLYIPRRSNADQRERLLNLVEQNKNVLFGSRAQGNGPKNQVWQDITSTLNKLGNEKTVDQWRKAWTDMKSLVKKKVDYLNKRSTTDGVDYPSDIQLTEEDCQIMRICNIRIMDGIAVPMAASSNLHYMHSNDAPLESSTLDSFQSLPETIQQNVEMENLQWMNHTDTIINFQKSLIYDLGTCEITIAFNDKSVKLHRCILAACSPLLRDVLRDVPIGQDATIMLPETNGNLLDNIVNFIYTGETTVSSSDLTEFLEAIGNLGIKSPIGFDCANVSPTTGNEEFLEEEIIDIDDEEEFTFVDECYSIEDSANEKPTASIPYENSHADQSGSTISTTLKKTSDTTAVILHEHLNMPSARSSAINKKSSDEDDVVNTDKVNESQTFRDRVNRLRVQQKKSLKKAFLAYSNGSMSLRKAATAHNISHSALLREVNSSSLRTMSDSSDDEEDKIKTDIIRLRKHIRVKSNPLDLPDLQFTKTFGMPKEAFTYVLDQVKDKLPDAIRSSSVAPALKLAATLRFLTEGSYQKGMGNDIALGLAQPTLSKILKDMLIAIETYICPHWIRSEYSEEDKMQAKLHFYKQAGIPGVIGCIGNTHVKILAPSQAEQRLYQNTKGFHSLNVMIVCDHQMFIRYVNPNQPGASDDVAVWMSSEFRETLKKNFQKGEKNTWLLGHGGYPLEPFLVTPFRKPKEGSNESSFNKRHLKTRNIIYKTIAILKNRFQCLLGEKQLHYTPQKSAQIVKVCAALHNICLHYKSFPEIGPIFQSDSDSDTEIIGSTHIDPVAVDLRNHLLEAIQKLH